MNNEHFRYLGCLGLLAECSTYVPEDIRAMIESALSDACDTMPGFEYRRVLDQLTFEVKDFPPVEHVDA